MTHAVPFPVHIDPNAVYTVGAIVLVLDIPSTTLNRARRAGDLPFVRRGRHFYTTGRALLAWLAPTAPSEMGKAVRS